MSSRICAQVLDVAGKPEIPLVGEWFDSNVVSESGEVLSAATRELARVSQRASPCEGRLPGGAA